MKELHWLPINQRITYKLCLMMHFIHTQQYPDYMRELMSITATTATRTGLRSASCLSYWKPRIRTKFGERAFSCSGPVAWNSLPIHLQTTTNTNTFKRLLKTYLFTTAYYLFNRFYRLCINVDYVMSAGLLCKWTYNSNVCICNPIITQLNAINQSINQWRVNHPSSWIKTFDNVYESICNYDVKSHHS